MKNLLLCILSSTLLIGCSDMTFGYESAEEYLATVDQKYKILYQSSNGEAVKTNRVTGNIRMISNSYESGQGIITFSLPVTEVYSGMFSNCTKLTSVTLPYGAKKISDNAFSGCTYLTDVNLPDQISVLGYNAFRGCMRLIEITLPRSMKQIDAMAFQECISLTAIYCKAETPPTGGERMFLGNSADRYIYVPRASVELYKEAQYWRDYAERIVGYDF